VANIRVGTVRAEVEPGPAPAPIPSDWWHPAWAFRARFELRRQGLGSGDCVTVPIDFAGATGAAEFDPGSVRVFERRGDWVEERPCLATPAGQAVLWQVGAGETDWPRPVEVYFDRRQTASKPRADWDVSALALDRWADDFEAAEAWDLAGASRAAQGRDASQALVFANDGSVKGPLLATCRRLRARPGARYRLHWSAKATGPEARLAANLYDGPRHDFPQVHTPLNADGQWHDYETVLVAGEFPDDVRPRLRLWTMPGSYTVAVDDVTIELVGATTPVPAAAAVRVESLPLAAR
jgi:hypothetical protein